MIYNENPCPSQIVSPSLFSRQRPSVSTELIPLLKHFSTKESFKQNQRSIDLIILVRLIHFQSN